MCGIYITNIPYEKEEVLDKLNLIKFRGPDNLGYSKKGNISLGHLRLAIVDLDVRSNQPFFYDKYSIVFNGEIYNFQDIRDELETLGHSFETTGDTEVLVKGYAVWGKDILQKINGMFAFAIYDFENEKVFCARDRLGVKPFYYYWKDGLFEICSQLKPLMNSESEVSEEAISIYLDCGYVPSPYSILKNVFKLSPGKCIEIDLVAQSMNISEYWNLESVTAKDISYEKAKEELHKLLIDAVKIRLDSDVPLGTFLSGGIDSALVTAIASKITTEKINTFTIGFNDPKFDESKIAEEFSKILGTNHKTTFCDANDALKLLPKFQEVYDEPFADSSALPSLLLNLTTKKGVTVALSGDGGDESFLGYNYFESIRKATVFFKVPYFIRSFLGLFIINKKSKFKEWLSIKNIDDFIVRIFVSMNSLNLVKNDSWINTHYSIFKKLASDEKQRAADLNIKLWLENDSNVKVDRASMAYAVEVRSPFLDYRIIEFARTLPVSFRYQKELRKKILRDILEEYIPSSVFNQPKRGFSIPLDDWIKNDLKEEILNCLNDSFLNGVPNLDVKKFRKQLYNHMEGTEINGNNIWKLYVLAKWSEYNNISLGSKTN
ncbi:asparagine synthase (glutamine-hydrolyzing) [Flavobacterium sp.]|uniref:asparagine synthase (glutamine-hydrolyzing) n=1 Tax=Flavobacterium sp. TaxID=239 RepID=UPI002618CF38|nr:asparagine synthase (glutamine-hydrolyzing) [Flavobacterium sp.]